jgi:hypothetical protein
MQPQFATGAANMVLNAVEIATLSILVSRRHNELEHFHARSADTQAMVDSEMAKLVSLWDKVNRLPQSD